METIISKFVKPVIKNLISELRMTGEYIQFLTHGRPNDSNSIILAGSGRSGTTWLSNLICSFGGIQQVFEPLHPRFSKNLRQLTGWEKDSEIHPLIRSYYLGPSGCYKDWNIFFERVFSRRERTYITEFERFSYFPEIYLYKMIRANMMLGYIIHNFDSRIIYLLRHPCAVVLSRLNVNWQANVNDILVQEELVENYLQPWVKKIELEKDNLGAHAVWWAVENMVALNEIKLNPHLQIFYEDLVLEPKSKLNELFNWLGIKNYNIVDEIITKPSWSTSFKENYNSRIGHLGKWKHKLNSNEQNRILKWASDLGIDYYNNNVLPNKTIL